jgi:hypothetical protein
MPRALASALALLPLALLLAACRPAGPSTYPPATVITTAAQAAQGSAAVAGTYDLLAVGTHSLPWATGMHEGCPVFLEAGSLTLTAEGRYRLDLSTHTTCDPHYGYAAANAHGPLAPHTAYQEGGTAAHPSAGPGTARSVTPSPPDPGTITAQPGPSGPLTAAERARQPDVTPGVLRAPAAARDGAFSVEGYYALAGNVLRFGNAMVVTRDIEAPQQVSGTVELADAILPYGRFDARGTVRDVVVTVTLRDLTPLTFARPTAERERPAPLPEDPAPVEQEAPGEDGEVPTLPETDEAPDQQPGPPIN